MKTCQWNESGDDLEVCQATELIPINVQNTADDGTVTEQLLGEMCAFHAFKWAKEHIAYVPDQPVGD